MIVSHNLLAMNANRVYSINSKQKASVTEKLSSGYRVNRAADDAAGLSISEKMRKQIRGLSQGVENTQDGVSLCQVADGALAEVSAMLHRITQLSVKAANGTKSEEDRQCMQEEINQLLTEIDRIGETTTFNEQPIFKGRDSVLTNIQGNAVVAGDIPFSDYSLADVDLGGSPFGASSGANTLGLRAIVNNPDSGAYGRTYNLIFGDGSTSSSSFRITDDGGNKTVVSMSDLSATNYHYDSANKIWSRDFNYVANGQNLIITQKVQIENTSDNEKNYVISYDFKNQQATNLNLEFMFHADTAYNNDDRCEGYFVNGNRLDKFCMYSKADSPITDGVTNAYVDKTQIPDSFSIVDVDNALAFSEKISFGAGDKPDSVSIGQYHRIYEWSYYNALDTELGRDAIRKDLGFSLYYDMALTGSGAGSSKSISFKYGIMATNVDQNLRDVPINKDTTVASEHTDKLSVWIQSGCEAGDGLNVVIGEMNSKVLGIDDLNVMDEEHAGEAIDKVESALHNITANRSKIGAQQNRLEHIIANENNIVENTTAAESTIRDADMAKEMMRLSMSNILEQANLAMMAQVNQSPQGVLNLLS